MTVVEKSILINANTDQIDAVTLDGGRFSEWYAGIQSSQPDATYPEAGGIATLVYRSAGVNFNMTMTSLRLVKGQSLLLKMDGMITGKSRWYYEAEGNGTRVHCHFEYEMPGGGLGKIADKLVVERMNISNLEKSLENLKTLVEGS
jgi:hypothetical protein